MNSFRSVGTRFLEGLERMSILCKCYSTLTGEICHQSSKLRVMTAGMGLKRNIPSVIVPPSTFVLELKQIHPFPTKYTTIQLQVLYARSRSAFC